MDIFTVDLLFVGEYRIGDMMFSILLEEKADWALDDKFEAMCVDTPVLTQLFLHEIFELYRLTITLCLDLKDSKIQIMDLGPNNLGLYIDKDSTCVRAIDYENCLKTSGSQGRHTFLQFFFWRSRLRSPCTSFIRLQ